MRFIFTLLVISSAVPAFGANYYFSDCATGGSGTLAGPWCLDPDAGGSALKRSFEYLVDGAAPEVAAGDTIYLCAGACDGAGSGTYHLDGHSSAGTGSGRPVVVDADIGGTSAAWITVQAYPGEDVIMSGDSNANNAWETSEPGTFFLNRQSNSTLGDGFGYWRFKDFTIEKFSGRALDINRMNGKEVEFDNMTIRYIGADPNVGISPLDSEAYYAPLAGDGGPVAMNCSMTQLNGSVSLENLNVFYYIKNKDSLLRVKNSRIYQSCAAVFRPIGNCYNAAGGGDDENCTNPGGILLEDSTIYATASVANGHSGGNWTFRRNTIYDVESGISAEERIRNITIEDNNISCRGTYQVRPTGDTKWCGALINITDGDGPGDCNAVDQPDPCAAATCACSSYNISIKRNKLWSLASGNGKAVALISFAAHNATANAGGGVNAVIENNMLWGQQSPFTCFPEGTQVNDFSRARGYALSLTTEDPVVVRNNTFYGNKCAVLIRSGFDPTWGGTAPVAHIVEGNISIDMQEQQAIRIESSAGGSTFRDNIFHQGSGSASNALHFNGTTYACNSSSFPGTNNRCVQPSFVNVSGEKSTWNLHLAPGDTQAKDRMVNGTAPSNDVDSQSRAGAIDIGADEFISDTTRPAAPINLRIDE